MSHRVVSTDPKTASGLPETFTWLGFDADVTVVSPATTTDLVEAAAGADALVVDANTQVTESVFTDTPVRVIARAGAGVDNIDLAAADRFDVPVVHAPDYCVEEVATHALALLLTTWRGVRRHDEAVRRGTWDRTPNQRVERLSETTVGLVSFGDTARRLATLLSGFDADLVAYDPHVDEETMAEYGVEKVRFESLLRRCALVSIHAPATPETRGLFDRDAFSTLADSAVVVNTGRGSVVDETALATALETEQIAGAGLDVLVDEPPEELPTEHPNVVYTPHVGWHSKQATTACTERVATDVMRVLVGDDPERPVRGDP